jgi:polyisoprenoid-binding protein YceI
MASLRLIYVDTYRLPLTAHRLPISSPKKHSPYFLVLTKKKTMKKILITLLLLGIGFYNYAQSYTADIKFYIKNLGSTVEGTLEGFDGEINFNAEDLPGSKIRATVDVATINTGINMRDNHLQAKSFFNEEEYPEIIMESQEINPLGDERFLGYFDLTIKGPTKVVEVPFSYTKSGNTESFKGSFTINRRDFDVGGGLVPTGDEVKVEIRVERSLD